MAEAKSHAQEKINDIQELILQQSELLPVVNDDKELDEKFADLWSKIKEIKYKTDNLHSEIMKERAKVEQRESRMKKMIQKLSQEEQISVQLKEKMDYLKKEEINTILNQETALQKLSEMFRNEPYQYEESKLKMQILNLSENLNAINAEIKNLEANKIKTNQLFFFQQNDPSHGILKNIILNDRKNSKQIIASMIETEDELDRSINTISREVHEIKSKYCIKNE